MPTASTKKAAPQKTGKPAATATAIPEVSGALLDAAHAHDENNKRLATIDAQFGDGLPYDAGRLIHETRFYLNQSAEALLEAGKRLILLKEHEPQGEFHRALEDIGIAPRSARKMMQAAVKYSGPATKKLVELGRSKMLELIAEDDEELEALAEGGTLAGHTLDDIERMSAKELREALRKERQKREHDKEATEKLLTSKDRKINDLHKQVHEREKKTQAWPFRVGEINIETTVLASNVLEACDQLDDMRDVILNEDFDGDEREKAIEAMAVVYYDAISQIVGRVGELMYACDEVFQGYKDIAKPMLDAYLEEQGKA